MRSATLSRGTKRALIAQVLTEDIGAGRYPLGTNLPSENELAQSFGVSRHTIRIALSELQDAGLVESRQGFGNIVRHRESAARYMQSFASIDDLLQYASKTVLEITGRSEQVMTRDMAAWIGCKPGERWWRVRATRRAQDSITPIAASEVFIPFRFGSVLKHLEKSGPAIFTMIERFLGQAMAEVTQEIQATRAGEEEAAILQVDVGDPVLAIIRRYYSASGELLEVSRSVHTSETFSYSLRIRLTAG